jgi:hypothetical protein
MISGFGAWSTSGPQSPGIHHVIPNAETPGQTAATVETYEGVLVGNQLARWFAVAVVGLSAIDMMFFIPAYPFWALSIIAMEVVALYGLCAYGSRANLAGV